MELLTALGDRLWTPWLLGLFLLTGLYFSLLTGFFQLFGIRIWMRHTLFSLFHKRKKGEKKRGLTQFQTMATALAATIGTGSIAGVATAIAYGGPGAVFWMWISAFWGMMTGCAEKTLALRYRHKEGENWAGGPMEYMEHGLHLKWMALWFALCITLAALGGGGVVQANSIASSLESTMGWNRWAVGAVTAAVVAVVVLGGIGRIGRVCEKLVPIMALGFMGGGVMVLLFHAEALPAAFRAIFSEAFAPRPVAGGALGYGMMTAMRYGIARGVFTNEAGLGSSAIAHAQANVKEPAEQGLWGVFEVFIATLVICTVTSLVILTAGIYDKGSALSAIEAHVMPDHLGGAPLVALSFGTVFGRLGRFFVAVCLLMFAFSSLLGWSYYGERGLSYLFGGRKGRWLFRLLFLGAILWGSVGELEAVWALSDLCNALMAFPNLTALLLLSPEFLRLWRSYMKKLE